MISFLVSSLINSGEKVKKILNGQVARLSHYLHQLTMISETSKRKTSRYPLHTVLAFMSAIVLYTCNPDAAIYFRITERLR